MIASILTIPAYIWYPFAIAVGAWLVYEAVVFIKSKFGTK